MKRIVALVGWLCRQLSLDELFTAAAIVLEVLNGDRPDIKCKDAFRLEHPHYRKFDVDPHPPLTDAPAPQRRQPSTDWRALIKEHRLRTGKTPQPVRRRDQATAVSHSTRCPNCNAPGKYIYYNDGQKRSQLRCKLCNVLSQVAYHHRPATKAKYWCPYCGYALYRWKQSEILTIYKCPNNKCSRYLSAKQQLNPKERNLRSNKSSQFKLRYQYRQYHFDPQYLVPASPHGNDLGRIDRIRNSFDTLGLVLALSVTYGLSGRMSAHMLVNVFGVSISHATVMRYLTHAAVLCHKFNLHYKGPLDPLVAGDETYIRVADDWDYTWFTIGTSSRAIHAYHLSDTRGVRDALITLKETLRTSTQGSVTDFVGDGNPSYDSAVHAINQQAKDEQLTPPLKRWTVIGLKNEDSESAQYRPFKQIIERLNRTYKFHTRARCGFKDFNGAVALTVLFVTHYNFLRAHSALKYKTPVPIPNLQDIRTIQGRWTKILHMAAELQLAA